MRETGRKAREGAVNQPAAHLITLLCAMIAKAEKGFEACLPKDCSLLAYRVLAQLSLPESDRMRAGELARALVARPTDVDAALASLAERDLVAHGEGAYAATALGSVRAREADARIGEFIEGVCEPLGVLDCIRARDMLYAILVKPGTFFAYRATSLAEGRPVPIPYCVTAVCVLSQAVGAATKSGADLSLTDFRILLELYPKRRGVEKRLRAKELVGYLRVGRSYVSTASARLVERDLIERIPDERDARGVLFALSEAGERVVRDVGDDVLSLVSGLIERRETDFSQLLRIMRLLMKGTDQALAAVREEAR